MDFLKRLCIYFGVILLCVSIYKDITQGTLHRRQAKTDQDLEINYPDASIIKVKVKPGDTVLSITEQINQKHFTSKKMDIQKILADFTQFNPNVNPNHLKVNEYYYFLDYDSLSSASIHHYDK
ncbi:MAG TPA: hypothetical protein VK142_06405 [Bacillota bacterium]|nr:hypothetical protein [Bacillota bacterium]